MTDTIESMAKARFAVLPIIDGNGEALTLSDLIVQAIEPASLEVMQAQMDESVRVIMTAAYNALIETLVPVGWCYVNTDGECEQIDYGPVFDDPSAEPLYALPEIDNG